MGANIIEKHFCISREIENPDASFSMNPAEFKEMVDTIRQVEKAKGQVYYGVSSQEESSLVFRRSVFTIADIKKGERFTEENTRIIRPGYGVKPKYLTDILGMKAAEDIERGTPVQFDLMEKKSILFLTNNQESLALYEWLKEHETGREVYVISNKLTPDMVKGLDPAFIVSYNYRHIIPGEILEYMLGKAVNLHVSYLPYNRGSSPNFFSFIDDTPKGVTIHEMTAGLDKGRILCQREIIFDEEKETFASSYSRLQQEIMELFKENWDAIKAGALKGFLPIEKGTYHTMKQLQQFQETHPFAWSDVIAEKKREWGL